MGEGSFVPDFEKEQEVVRLQQLLEDIKNGSFARVYLLYGEETYLRLQYRDKLKKALIPDGDTMNYHYFEGKGVDTAQLIDLAETLPFFQNPLLQCRLILPCKLHNAPGILDSLIQPSALIHFSFHKHKADA